MSNTWWFVRIQPPLNIDRSVFEQGMDILEEAVEAVNAAR